MKTQKRVLRSIGLGAAILVVLIVYAYGFKVTKVNFKETSSERRLTQLTRILRALAHPDVITYDLDEAFVEAPFYLPCPEEPVTQPEPDTSSAYLVTNVPCADAKSTIIVEGYNIVPRSRGPVNFLTASGVKLQLGNFIADDNGNFRLEVELPNRQPVAEAQHIQAIVRVRVGGPKISDTARVTWDKIVETVFLALLATTIGTFLAIPISFIAARNLMKDVTASLTGAALTIIGWPLGIGVGLLANRWVTLLSEPLTTGIWINLGATVISPIAIYALVRIAIPQRESEAPKTGIRITRLVALLGATLLGILTLQVVSALALRLGTSMTESLPALSFVGNFITQLGDVLQIITPAIIALAAGMTIGNTFSNLGQIFSDRSPARLVKGINFILSAVAGGLLFVLIGAGINWFYEINDPVQIYLIPGLVGAALGLLLALRTTPKDPMPLGITLYFITRTILNGTRSVEPLVMVIVFAVWVGIGPFAGAMALALHTVAALAKLYSEQVESILPGPLEAVTATGANRLQTIAYAVVPQIVPPYISFTMYRWDINVRMSTIIGFAGGGGIGFLLQQNINLLDYRAASAQMLAIAIVVASMDYISSTLRERFV